jgi:hypothetical protein
MLLLELEKDLLDVKPKEKFLVLTTNYKKNINFSVCNSEKSYKNYLPVIQIVYGNCGCFKECL